ncbi:MAG TPA: hypothetical protein VFB13_13545 [Reyranella sp.]|nr:hypothetical protein [Reyranella sp.]
MFRYAAFALLLLAAPACWAQDCTADVGLAAGLKLDVHYRCRSDRPLVFDPGGRVDSKGGVVDFRYKVALADRDADPHELILRGRGGEPGALATLGTWLAEPRGFDHLPVIDLRVTAADGLAFAAGLPRVGDAWRLAGTSVSFAGYSALGHVSVQEIAVPAPGSLRPEAAKEQGVLRLAILDGVSDTARADLAQWVRRTAEAESNYWQGFTARQMLVGLVPTGARGPAGYGRTVSGGGPTVMVEVNRDVDAARLLTDWVLVHELVHTGMPYLMRRATWFMEGAATYVEPIIRARAGWKSEPEVWREWLDNMPRGVDAFSRGLANASGREVYWAGALFMLMADIAIHRESNGAKGLRDCLAGALWSGFDGPRRVLLKDYAAACDRATGTHVVSELIERYEGPGHPVDLAALWKELGVGDVEGRIVLDDTAPLARWRKMIVMG